jgi:uncharacterized protein
VPENLFPGVIVEETSFRARPIEGVPTGRAGFVGRTAQGVIRELRHLQSLPEFETAFGRPASAVVPGAPIPDDDFLWHAARAFFNEGGKRLSVVRTNDSAGGASGPDDIAQALAVLEDDADVEIVAAPGSGAQDDAGAQATASALVDHAERMRFRFALIDSPRGADLSAIETFRGRLASSRAALYYPWIRDAAGTLLPPSGYVAGLIAKNDSERAVWKAPANMVVAGAAGFELSINEAQQELLNPQGINCFRTFTGHGHRLWGARTLTRDPEFKYVNVRRLLSFVERSIEAGTQWTVFEPHGEPLWAYTRSAVEDFLMGLWRQGALAGTTPQQSFFVRCDRSTMTQADIDIGRLIVEIGLAPVKPAEFVIMRIGLWTADRTV